MSTLKDLRFEANLSQNELARRANVDIGTVRRAESGQPVQELKAYQIARALGQALGREITIQDISGLNLVE